MLSMAGLTTHCDFSANPGPFYNCRGSTFVVIPAERADSVVAVTASGPACSKSEPSCNPNADRSQVWCFIGDRDGVGKCTVVVEFSTGEPPFVATIDFRPDEDDPFGDCGPTGRPDRVFVPGIDGGAVTPGDAGADSSVAE
jgi:hypothetical protein